MKVNWSEFTKLTLKEDFASKNKECVIIGMIAGITNLDHYTDKEKVETIKTILKSYNETINELLEIKD